jgi:hypothetical protein
MDVNVLTCLVEQLCAKLLIQEKKLYQGDYHYLHIPKSWLQQYFEKVPDYASRFGDKQSLIRVLVTLMSFLHRNLKGEAGSFLIRVSQSLCPLGC